MSPADAATPLAAFIAGVVTSVHCTAMCGPLGCALLGSKTASPKEWRRAALYYHISRAISYGVWGAFLGAVGASAAGFFQAPLSRLLPWAMVMLFVVLAFGWEQRLPRIPFLTRFLVKLNLRAAAWPRQRVAVVLGAATPFLPCGPLYLIFGVALISGSWAHGALLTTSFALGTIPLFALAQIYALGWQAQLTPRAQLWTRRGLALGSAILVGGRAAFHSGSLLAPVKCLFCH